MKNEHLLHLRGGFRGSLSEKAAFLLTFKPATPLFNDTCVFRRFAKHVLNLCGKKPDPMILPGNYLFSLTRTSVLDVYKSSLVLWGGLPVQNKFVVSPVSQTRAE